MTRELHLKAVDSAVEGGCNGCREKSGPGLSYRVWQLRLRDQTIRLCDACMAELPGVLQPGFDEVRKVEQPLLCLIDEMSSWPSPALREVARKGEMTRAEMEARIQVLSDEMDANDEENRAMQDEIDALYKKIDAMPPDEK